MAVACFAILFLQSTKNFAFLPFWAWLLAGLYTVESNNGDNADVGYAFENFIHEMLLLVKSFLILYQKYVAAPYLTVKHSISCQDHQFQRKYSRRGKGLLSCAKYIILILIIYWGCCSVGSAPSLGAGGPGSGRSTRKVQKPLGHTGRQRFPSRR